jgi:glycosyltransferase involved in cell wall biosynthesis
MVSPKYRILMLSPFMIGGGTERVMMDLVADLRLRGHEVLPVSISRRVAMPPWFESRHGHWMDLVHLEWDLRYNRPGSVWEAKKRLQKVVREFAPQIIHSHLWDASLIAALASNRRSVAHICHLHNHEPWKESTSLKHRTRRMITRGIFGWRKTQYIACSASVAAFESQSLGVSPDLIHVARNAVDVDFFQPAPHHHNSNRLRIGTAGAHVHRKNHLLLISALAEITRAGHDVELIIAGEGPLTPAYKQRAGDLGIADRLSLPGSVTDMQSFYHGIDLFVLPSLHEGLPLVVLEAMACGKPIISSDLPGMNEAVHENVNGLLFENNHQAVLVRAMKQLLADRERLAPMGHESRRIILESFSPGVLGDRIESIYCKVLSSR